MDLSGLTEHLAAVEDEAALLLPIGDRTYRVRPPSVAVGARCAALMAAQRMDDDTERAEAVVEALGDTPFPVLALGAQVVEEMQSDGVPGVVVNECARVALLAWTSGPAAAQRYLDRSKGDASGEAKAPHPRRKSGAKRGSGSGSKTR
ncbi:hypothetical protein UQW22_09875 [Isoptericola halotolerans]|uniref:DUF7426 family protein n=1 Tax=Isoptericola halotolerans TaxID=300560 RepID=UPI00388F95FA